MRTIIEDTRNRVGMHDEKVKVLESLGHIVVRSKLPYGDYALMPNVSIDTKRDIYELAQDIDQEHDRFRRELIGAQDTGCHLVVLTINRAGVTDLPSLARWVEPVEHFKMRKARSRNVRARRIDGERLAKACATMEKRYGVRFLFCSTEEEAGMIIHDILGGDGDGKE